MIDARPMRSEWSVIECEKQLQFHISIHSPAVAASSWRPADRMRRNEYENV